MKLFTDGLERCRSLHSWSQAQQEDPGLLCFVKSHRSAGQLLAGEGVQLGAVTQMAAWGKQVEALRACGARCAAGQGLVDFSAMSHLHEYSVTGPRATHR